MERTILKERDTVPRIVVKKGTHTSKSGNTGVVEMIWTGISAGRWPSKAFSHLTFTPPTPCYTIGPRTATASSGSLVVPSRLYRHPWGMSENDLEKTQSSRYEQIEHEKHEVFR